MKLTREDLKDYIETENGMTLIRHPLYVGLFAPFISVNIIKCIESKTKAVKDALEAKNFRQFIFLHERSFRLNALVSVITEFMPYSTDKQILKEKADLIRSVWVDTEFPNVNKDTWYTLFGSVYILSRERLPNFEGKLTIYRGSPEEGKEGMSWTLSKDTAKFFANRFDIGGKVWTLTVTKEDILAYLTEREEEEIILKKSSLQKLTNKITELKL